jgi:hypothetical protein
MTDPTSPPAAAAPATTQPPPGGSTPAAAASAAPPPSAEKPSWLPDSYWSPQSNSVNLDAFKSEFETRAALAARKGDDIKFEVKLPPEVKLPDGYDVRITKDDPRIPMVREIAIKNGLPQEVVNDLVNMDARLKVQSWMAETERIKAEDAKLGENAQARKDAVTNWLKGLVDKKVFSQDEFDAVVAGSRGAAFVTALEKIIGKLAGNVPGNQPGAPAVEPKPPEKTLAQRWYPNMPSLQPKRAS